MSKHIHIRTENGITRLTMSRADKKNALTQDMYAAMADALAAYASDTGARAFVITGDGDVFTAGNDLQDFSVSEPTEMPPVARFLSEIRDCPKPVIAAVNGPAIGVGLTMLLHCDLVYAAQSARFSAPFVKLGLVPEAASSLLLPASVGMAVANDILLAGRTLNAQEAHHYGLVSRVFEDAELAAAVEEIAATIAGSAPSSLKRSKELIRNRRDQIADHMATEGKAFAHQLKSSDFSESVAAMMEKRPPVYS